MRDPYIELYSGGIFHCIRAVGESDEEVQIEDIAHGLSLQCRYAGHCKRFYSVAEHSVLVSYLVRPENALYGLLHDASEAYISDIPSPFKSLLPDYHSLEENVQSRILNKFNLLSGYTEEVRHDIHENDMALLICEAKMLVASGGKNWGVKTTAPIPDTSILKYHNPQEAKELFLNRFLELTDVRP